MIDRIFLENFRGFKRLKLDQMSPINLLVGDNGSGKTTVLEAIHLALSSQTETAMRIRQFRGFETVFQGTHQVIERGLWGDLFHNGDMSQVLSVRLEGSEPFARYLTISRRKGGESFLPFTDEPQSSDPITFSWTNAEGQTGTAVPRITSEGLKLPVGFDERNVTNFFPASLHPSSQETATRFSELSQRNEEKDFVELFRKEYKWIQDISIETIGIGAALFARTSKRSNKIPLQSVSGGINRIVSILLAIYTTPNSVILIDEIENGQYYSHMQAIWRLIFDLADRAKSQIFLTTHSQECIQALLSVAKGKKQKDLSLHQFVRTPSGYNAHTFSGREASLALEYGEEIR